METTRVKAARRLLLALLLLATLPLIVDQAVNAPAFARSGPDPAIRELLAEGRAASYDLDAALVVDGMRLSIDRAVATDDALYLYYRAERDKGGWSFPDSALQLTDERGTVYLWRGGYASGKYWGQTGAFMFDRPDDPLGRLTLSFERYDRSASASFALEERSVSE